MVAGCVIFHRRQLLLREPRIPPPSFCSFDPSRFLPSRSPSSFTLRSQPLLLLLLLLVDPPLFLSLFLFLSSTAVASTRGSLLVSFRPLVANIRNVCGGHATGHQLHDLRFADLASGVHRCTQGCALVQRTASRVRMHARDTQRARHRSEK